MAGTSYPDLTTAPLESGMLILVLHLAILSMGTLPGCHPLLALPMAGASYPDLTTAPFESGMPRLVLQSEIVFMCTLTRGTLTQGTLTWCGLSLVLPMGGALSPQPLTPPFESGILR